MPVQMYSQQLPRSLVQLSEKTSIRAPMPVVNAYGVLVLFSPRDTCVISVAENPGRLRRGREREYYVRRIQNGNQIVHGILLTNRLGLNHGKMCSKCACLRVSVVSGRMYVHFLKEEIKKIKN